MTMLYFTGEEFITFIRTKRPSIWLRVMQQFEIKKRTFEKDKDLRITIHHGFASCYEEMYGRKIDSVSDSEGFRVSANSDFVIPAEKMKTLFDAVVDGISDQIFNGLNRAKEKQSPVKYIFLVGGFSDCKFVQESIRHIESTYRPETTVLIPMEASLCVLRGAVLYGHNPAFIKSRMSGLTYAIVSERPYKKDKDDDSRMERVHGKLVVKYLDAIIKKGDAVPEGTMRKRTVKIAKSAKSIEKEIYISEQRTVDNPSSSSVRRLGKLVVELLPTTTTKNKDKDVEIQFIFGNTELEVRTAEDSGATVNVFEDDEPSQDVQDGIKFQRREPDKCIVM